jgi:hypothetical protein
MIDAQIERMHFARHRLQPQGFEVPFPDRVPHDRRSEAKAIVGLFTLESD